MCAAHEVVGSLPRLQTAILGHIPWMTESMGGASRLGAAVDLQPQHLQHYGEGEDATSGPMSYFAPSSMWKPAEKDNWRLLHDGLDLVALWYMHLSDFAAAHPLTNSSDYAELLERVHQGNHIHPACLARSCALVKAMAAFTTGSVERGHSLRRGSRGWLSSCGPHRHVRPPSALTLKDRDQQE